jgi:D-tyrosyl-tRNA(Tyr) deacylase
MSFFTKPSNLSMKVLIQRVSEARVDIGERCTGKIGNGLLVLLGIHRDDTEKDIDYLARKVINLRVFEDPEGKMNLSVADIEGELLVVSQFTLAAKTRRGNRPSFDDAAAPEEAENMYNIFINRLRESGLTVRTGEFGEYMRVSLVNDGPVTIMIDSRKD